MARSWIGLLLIGALLVPAAAHAQSASETATARRLFRDGLEAARGGDWQTARDHFARSYGIAPRPNTLLNLAGAQVQTGRLVNAAESYRRFIAEATGRARRFRRQARAALAELEPRLAHLTVSVEGGTGGERVTLDGDELPSAALGVEMPVDPGEHTLVVRRGAASVAEQRVSLEEGQHEAVALDSAPSLEVSAQVSETSAPEEAFESDSGEGDDTGLIVGVTSGAVLAVALGVTLGVFFALDSQGPHQGNLGAGVVPFD